MEGIEVVEVRENKMVGRREVKLMVDHFGKGTPKRSEIREALSKMFDAPLDNIYVINISTEYGLNRSWVLAHIYDSAERALQIEPEHIVRKNRGVKEEGGEG